MFSNNRNLDAAVSSLLMFALAVVATELAYVGSRVADHVLAGMLYGIATVSYVGALACFANIATMEADRVLRSNVGSALPDHSTKE